MRFPPLPPIVKNLLIINVIITLAMIVAPSLEASLNRLCALHYFSSPGFNPAQLVTYMFLHANLTHLFFNMFALVMFGGIIERAMGSARFLTYYLACGIMAALIQMGVYAAMLSHYQALVSPEDYQHIISEGWNVIQSGMNFVDPTAGTINALVNGSMVGASGAIYGVILAFGMLFPNQPLYLFFIPVPIKAKWMVFGYGLIELASGLSTVTSSTDNVAHFAHLGGMIAGVILILYWKKKGVFNNRWFF